MAQLSDLYPALVNRSLSEDGGLSNYHLGYTDDYLKTKTAIQTEVIGKGRRRRTYFPDYVGFSERAKLRPILVIDAKSPNESAEDGVRDAQDYAAVMHRRLEDPKPEIYCMGTSGTRTVVKHFDRDKPDFDLLFEEIVDGNPQFEDFCFLLSRASLSRVTVPTEATFEFRKPELDEIRGIFQACHDIIWSKEDITAQSAFYKFSKLMFIKLREDRKLRDDPEVKRLIETRQPLPPNKVIFSLRTIIQNEDANPNPIDVLLFRRLRQELETEIIRGRKKRIFDSDEELDLKPTTVREVVKYLEHYDLFGIDEDLNGRMFETFLSATMRGRSLGQFFTPRTVVDFMARIVDASVTQAHIASVIDLCCGTGGFLIEAMAIMSEKAQSIRTLTASERDELVQRIRDR